MLEQTPVRITIHIPCRTLLAASPFGFPIVCSSDWRITQRQIASYDDGQPSLCQVHRCPR